MWGYIIGIGLVLYAWNWRNKHLNDPKDDDDPMFYWGMFVVAGIILYIKIEPYLGAIGGFLEIIFYIFLIVGLATLIIFGIQFLHSQKVDKEDQENQRIIQEERKKREIEAATSSRKRKALAFAKEQEEREEQKALALAESNAIRKKEYNEALEILEIVKQQNKEIRGDIAFIKPAVAGLSVFDDDFLEQYPKVLEYIDNTIQKRRV